ncbi:melanocyte-stimulating hormone receptor-like [Oculina patagonica]
MGQFEGNQSDSDATGLRCFFVAVNLEVPMYMYVFKNFVMVVFNSLFSLIATTSNTLVMITIWRTPSLQTPSNTLLCCLALSDLFVGVLPQPCFVPYKIAEIKQDFHTYCLSTLIIEVTGLQGTGVTLLTLAATSIDKCISLFYPLRYLAIVTTSRIVKFVISFWGVFLVLNTARFSGFVDNTILTLICSPVILGIILLTVGIYLKIFLLAKRQRARICNEANIISNVATENELNTATTAKRKKSAITMAYVFGLFLLCYTPLLCSMVLYSILGFPTEVKAVFNISLTIAFMNSSLNPALYCWKFRELRSALRKILQRGQF